MQVHAPRLARPFILPFCIFLNFVLFGCNIVIIFIIVKTIFIILNYFLSLKPPAYHHRDLAWPPPRFLSTTIIATSVCRHHGYRSVHRHGVISVATGKSAAPSGLCLLHRLFDRCLEKDHVYRKLHLYRSIL